MGNIFACVKKKKFELVNKQYAKMEKHGCINQTKLKYHLFVQYPMILNILCA